MILMKGIGWIWMEKYFEYVMFCSFIIVKVNEFIPLKPSTVSGSYNKVYDDAIYIPF